MSWRLPSSLDIRPHLLPNSSHGSERNTEPEIALLEVILFLVGEIPGSTVWNSSSNPEFDSHSHDVLRRQQTSLFASHVLDGSLDVFLNE